MTSLGAVGSERVQISVQVYKQKVRTTLSIPNITVEHFDTSTDSDMIAKLADNVRASIAEACRRSVSDYCARDAATRMRHMRQVSEAGAVLFKELVKKEDRDKFRAILSAHAGDTIWVSGTGVSIPWEALCFADEPALANHEDFLGWNHAVSREVGFSYVRSIGPPVIEKVGEVGLVEDDKLQTVIKRKTYEASTGLGAGIPRTQLKPLEVHGDEEHFYEFLQDDKAVRRVVQFDCHIEKANVLPASHVRVTNAFKLKYEVFEQVELPHQPFVFFSACSAGSVTWPSDEGYASRIYAGGATLVIAAEAELGDAMMADFLSTFYLLAPGSGDCSEALLKTRRIFLAEHKNPSPLFYGLYGDVRLKLGGAQLSSEKQTELSNLERVLVDLWPPERGPDPEYGLHRRRTRRAMGS